MTSHPDAVASSDRSAPHHPGLDGLRGLAVAGVLLYHGGFSWAKGGFLGVSTFFTLSGFLITGLLVAEHRRSGRIALGAFWGKRFRRLMPAALAALLGVALFAATVADADQLRAVRADALSALAYVANWRFVLSGRTYGDTFGAPSPVQHFWSLAIEEQFYVLFPLLAALLLTLGRGRVRYLAVVCSALVAASVGAAWATSGTDQSRAYFGTDTRAAELLLGSLLAMAAARRPLHLLRGRLALLVAAVGVPALALTLFLWSSSHTADRWLYRGGLLGVAALSTALVVAAVVRGPVRMLFSLRPLRVLGTYSYGLYLYHWPIFLWLTGKRTGLAPGALFTVRMAATAAVAIASYHLLEQPVRRQRILAWRPTIVAPAMALVTAFAILAASADPPPPTFDFASSSVSQASPVPAPPAPPTPPAPPAAAEPEAFEAPEPVEPEAAVPATPLRVMVVGDSVASVLGAGLQRWGERTGSAVVWNVAIPGCGTARGGLIYDAEGGSRPTVAGCDAWATRWPQQMREFAPDVVVMHSGPWEMTTRKLPGWSSPLPFGDPVMDDFVAAEYTAAVDVLGSTGARVVWVTMPCMHSYEGTESPIWDTDLVRHLDRDLIIGRVARQRPTGVRVVDLFRRVCPGGEFVDVLGGVTDARPDGVHFVPAASDWIADWLGPQLAADPPATATASDVGAGETTSPARLVPQ